jgi:hypothetical protein
VSGLLKLTDPKRGRKQMTLIIASAIMNSILNQA